MRLDHRQLRAFLLVAELGTVGRAAKEIHLTQPALSRLIKEFERSCGAVLFERHPLGMRLTEAGRSLVPFARSILHDLARAEETLGVHSGSGKGVVRVGAIAGVARQILPNTVKSLLDRNLDIQVHLLEGSGGELAAALTDGTIDIAIAHDDLADEEVSKVRGTRYFDCCNVVCSTDHPLAQKPECSLDDALGARWVLPRPEATPRKLLQGLVHKAGRPLPSATVETTSPSAVAAFVRRTNLLGWLPRSLYADEEEAGQICALNVPELTLHRRYFIYRRRRGLLPPAAVAFLNGFRMIAD